MDLSITENNIATDAIKTTFNSSLTHTHDVKESRDKEEKCMLCKTKYKPKSLQELQPGDHIQVPIYYNFFHHHAIVVDVTNIQADGRRADIQVIDVPRKAKKWRLLTKAIETKNHLLKGKPAAKCEDIDRIDYRKRRHDKPTTLARAEKAKPKGKYQLFFNNCEHFATSCVSGMNRNDASTRTQENNRFIDASQTQAQRKTANISYLDVNYTIENRTDASNETPYLDTFIDDQINETVIDDDAKNSSLATASNKIIDNDYHHSTKLSNDQISTIETNICNDTSLKTAAPENDKRDIDLDNTLNSKSKRRTDSTAPQNDKHDNEQNDTVDIDNVVSSQAAACLWRFINVCIFIMQLSTYIFNFYIFAIFVGKDETFDHFDDSMAKWIRKECYNPSRTVIGFRTICDWFVLAVFLGLFALILCALVCRQRKLNRKKLICKQCYKSTCCIYGFRLLVFLIVDMFNNFCERYLYRLLSWLGFDGAFTVFIIITLAIVEGLYIYFVSHYLVVSLFYVLGRRRRKTLPICVTCCGTEIEEDSFKYVTIHF